MDTIDKINPYEAPKTDVLIRDDITPTHIDNGIRRHGKKQLFVPSDADLPARCIKCNDTFCMSLYPLVFHYEPQALITTFIVSIVVLAIFSLLQWFVFAALLTLLVSAFTYKKRIINVGLCQKHSKIRRRRQILAIATVILGFALLFIQVNYQFIDTIVINYLAIFLIFGGFLLLNTSNRLIKNIKINKTGTFLKGFGKDFLQSFR